MTQEEKLLRNLHACKNEKDVENAWRAWVSEAFSVEISSPDKVDGLAESDKISCLMEFKHNIDMKDAVAKSRVLAQVIFYLKRLELKGIKLPKAVLIGDVNECVILETRDLLKYLEWEVNWLAAASRAANNNPDLVVAISSDLTLLSQTFDLVFESDIKRLKKHLESICSPSLSLWGLFSAMKRQFNAA